MWKTHIPGRRSVRFSAMLTWHLSAKRLKEFMVFVLAMQPIPNNCRPDNNSIYHVLQQQHLERGKAGFYNFL